MLTHGDRMYSISKAGVSSAIASFVLIAISVLSSSCGEELHERESDPRHETLAWVQPRLAMTMPLDRLEALENAWARQVAWGGVEGVTSARRAAELARIRALRDPSSRALVRARDLLRQASESSEFQGSCDAALDLARLEARDAQDLRAAYLAAYRTTRLFQGEPNAVCTAEATRMLGVLTGYRPDDAVLSAFDPVARIQSISIQEEDIQGAKGVRVVITLDRVVSFHPQEISAQDGMSQLIIDVEDALAAPTLEHAISVEAGGLQRVRHVRREHGARVVLSLESEVNPRVFILPSPFRIVVDIVRERQVPRTAPAPEMDLLVLDPGHGGNDYGARAFDLEEADVALDLALRVREILRARRPRMRVVLTRERDVFVSLEQRAAMANAIDADAFVSIHLNASDDAVSHGGVTTFVLDTTNERQALRLAARENGASISEIGELSRILAGFRREEQVSASRALAERIHLGVLTGGRTVLPTLHDRGVRTAMFYVLVGATMPAVLVEASFMTREDEANALHHDGYRQALADGMAEGIIRWTQQHSTH